MAGLFTDFETRPIQGSPLTPVQYLDEQGIWLKRDDYFVRAGVRGGKARTCSVLAKGASGLVTSGSRSSPQANIVAHIAQQLGIPARIHAPTGELSPELVDAQSVGAEIIQHKAGYNSVIKARANEDATARGWINIPFGMECNEHVRQTRSQVRNVPLAIKRLVVPVGGGMSLAGILWGMWEYGLTAPVLGVVVGGSPTAHLDCYAPNDWRRRVTLIPSGTDYHESAENSSLTGIKLDPHYEAKTISFLQPGDLLWIVGIRRTAE